MPSYQKILILCCQQHHSFHLSLGEVRSKAGNDLLSLLQSRLGATEGQVNNPVTWWRFELASLSYFSGWFFFVGSSHSQQHSRQHTASELLFHLLDIWRKRSDKSNYCTTQTALPTLNPQHSSPVHPALPSPLLASARGLWVLQHPLLPPPDVQASCGCEGWHKGNSTSTKHRLQLPPQTGAAGERHGWTHKWIHEWRNEPRTGEVGTEEENKTRDKTQDAEIKCAANRCLWLPWGVWPCTPEPEVASLLVK